MACHREWEEMERGRKREGGGSMFLSSTCAVPDSITSIASYTRAVKASNCVCTVSIDVTVVLPS